MTEARVAVTGMSVMSAFGRGPQPLLAAALAGRPAFGPASRFSVDGRRAQAVAELPGTPVLVDELADAIGTACDVASLDRDQRSAATLLVAQHTDAAAARQARPGTVVGEVAAEAAARSGMPAPPRVYLTACVAASTAIADAAVMIVSGRADRVVVAAGYLVDADSFALFDGGRVLARDGQVRPFSAGRQGMLLGDGVAAVVLESAAAARARGAAVAAWLAGWGRAGDAYHVAQPSPEGSGLARAIGAALRRARLDPADIGYVNASGSGTRYADASEAAGLHTALGGHARKVPVSSTKSVHGHALEASALLEFVLTILTVQAGLLPVNAGFVAPDPSCELELVLGTAREERCRYALSLNAAFGGANTALVVAAP
ncbi:MAG: beta-ketoacyl synthase N-terminal-like domain-containing protein [Streptosporangiaceae bacterium]